MISDVILNKKMIYIVISELLLSFVHSDSPTDTQRASSISNANNLSHSQPDLLGLLSGPPGHEQIEELHQRENEPVDLLFGLKHVSKTEMELNKEQSNLLPISLSGNGKLDRLHQPNGRPIGLLSSTRENQPTATVPRNLDNLNILDTNVYSKLPMPIPPLPDDSIGSVADLSGLEHKQIFTQPEMSKDTLDLFSGPSRIHDTRLADGFLMNHDKIINQSYNSPLPPPSLKRDTLDFFSGSPRIGLKENLKQTQTNMLDLLLSGTHKIRSDFQQRSDQIGNSKAPPQRSQNKPHEDSTAKTPMNDMDQIDQHYLKFNEIAPQRTTSQFYDHLKQIKQPSFLASSHNLLSASTLGKNTNAIATLPLIPESSNTSMKPESTNEGNSSQTRQQMPNTGNDRDKRPYRPYQQQYPHISESLSNLNLPNEEAKAHDKPMASRMGNIIPPYHNLGYALGKLDSDHQLQPNQMVSNDIIRLQRYNNNIEVLRGNGEENSNLPPSPSGQQKDRQLYRPDPQDLQSKINLLNEKSKDKPMPSHSQPTHNDKKEDFKSQKAIGAQRDETYGLEGYIDNNDIAGDSENNIDVIGGDDSEENVRDLSSSSSSSRDSGYGKDKHGHRRQLHDNSLYDRSLNETDQHDGDEYDFSDDDNANDSFNSGDKDDENVIINDRGDHKVNRGLGPGIDEDDINNDFSEDGDDDDNKEYSVTKALFEDNSTVDYHRSSLKDDEIDSNEGDEWWYNADKARDDNNEGGDTNDDFDDFDEDNDKGKEVGGHRNDEYYHRGQFPAKGILDNLDGDVEETKPPTAPTNMVLFYTWMILVILIMVIVVSTYQAKCKGLLSYGNRQPMRGVAEDRKRLLEDGYV